MWKILEEGIRKTGLLYLKSNMLSLNMREGESLEIHILECEDIVRDFTAVCQDPFTKYGTF